MYAGPVPTPYNREAGKASECPLFSVFMVGNYLWPTETLPVGMPQTGRRLVVGCFSFMPL